jgi:PAS domain S-box-containing protein
MRSNAVLVEGVFFRYLTYGINPLTYVFILFNYLIYCGVASLLVVHFFRSKGLRRTQTFIFILAGTVPVLGSLITLTILRDSLYRDISPLTSAIASLLVVVGLFRFSLFSISSGALNTIVEIMHDGVILLDGENRVGEINPSAQRILDLAGEKYIGLAWTDLFARWPATVRQIQLRQLHETFQTEVEVEINNRQRFIHLTIQPLSLRMQNSEGMLVVLRDMTVRRKMEEGVKHELAARRRAENKLRLLNEDLEQRVAERTAELSQLYTEMVQELENRRKVEEALRQSEERYALAARGANDGLWDWDLTNNVMFYSDRWKAILGFEAGELSTIRRRVVGPHPSR